MRIADADRVRLGAHLAEGTTVMHEGFVNFNAGTLGPSMVEGRISSGVVVGDGSDVGGGASIMGTLSGGGKEVISIGERCLLGANAGIGISLGDDCVVEAGCYVTAGTKVTLPDGRVVKAAGAVGLRPRAVPPQLRHGHDRGRPVEGAAGSSSTPSCTPTERAGALTGVPMTRRLAVLLAVTALVFGAGAVYLTLRDGSLPSLIAPVEECQAGRRATRWSWTWSSPANAALISAISVQRGMPARAATIALATAYQESDLRNLEYGDRDSLGLFQQRPSQGWGSRAQLLDPYFSVNAFYDALAQVDGYLTMPVTQAAQQVQRSGFPGAYADHEQDARVLASALTGNSRAAFWCTVDDDRGEVCPDLDDAGLTERAAAVRADLARTFGDLALGGFAPGGVSEGHMPGSAHYEGRAIDVFVRPISRTTSVAAGRSPATSSGRPTGSASTR